MRIDVKGILMLASVFILLSIPRSYAQSIKPGKLSNLIFDNGMNGIKLGADIGYSPANELNYLQGNPIFDADSCRTFELTNQDLLDLGEEVVLQSLVVRVYKNKVIDILGYFKVSEGYKFLSLFLTKYGQFTNRPDNFQEIYEWNSTKISLLLGFSQQSKLGVVVFRSPDLENEVINRRKKAVARILSYVE